MSLYTSAVYFRGKVEAQMSELDTDNPYRMELRKILRAADKIIMPLEGKHSMRKKPMPNKAKTYEINKFKIIKATI